MKEKERGMKFHFGDRGKGEGRRAASFICWIYLMKKVHVSFFFSEGVRLSFLFPSSVTEACI